MPDLPFIPHLYFGTALWGWTIPKENCYQLLDYYYEKGFRKIDCATNYPINKNPDQFRWAENNLEDWIKAHQVNDLEIIMKVGSLDNMMSPDNNISKTFLIMNLRYYQAKFGDNLRTLMIHWDNRADEKEIKKSFEALSIVQEQGIQPGLSGIKHPAIYAALNQQFQLDFEIQIKHNLLQSAYEHYKDFHGQPRFVTYGINAGGLKLDHTYTSRSSLSVRKGAIAAQPPIVDQIKRQQALFNQNKERPALTTFNHFGMIYAFYQPDAKGILLGTSRVEQLKESIQFYEHLKTYDYSDVYTELKG